MATTANIPDLQGSVPIVDENGQPTMAFHIWWAAFKANLIKTIEDTVTAALSANWSLVVDDNGMRPDDNATLGADWTGNVTSRPTELTDGRVSAGLTSAGDLNRNITTARANSSNILRKTSGGLYTGDLAATQGATWGVDVASRPTELTDGRISAALDSSGTLQTNIPSSLANSSNLLRKTSGGLYTGALNATFGADLGSNVTNVIPTNLPPINTAGSRYKFTGAISYTSTTTNATISVAAGSLKVGTTTVSYNAMSVGTTGSGGPTTYYLYVSSNAFSNGAHTLNASTNPDDLFDDDNKVWIGSVDVTYAASGSGGGSGGGGFCPVDTTEILMADGSQKMMKDCKVGEYVWTIHEDSGEFGAYRISDISFIEDETLYLEGYPRATRGHRFSVGGSWKTLEVLGGQPSGMARVCRLTVEDAHTYISDGILSHNTKPL